MKNFKDFAAFRSVLEAVDKKSPSEPEQRLADFAAILEQQLDFTKDDAALYASVVLKRNGEGPGDS